MTLQEMNEALPNGLHDAEILAFTYDLLEKTLKFQVDVWIGTMAQPTTLRERYRRGVLTFEGVEFFAKGEPENLSDGQLQFLDWTFEEDQEERLKLPETFKGKLFDFYPLYCSMRVGCADVYIEWDAVSETNRLPGG